MFGFLLFSFDSSPSLFFPSSSFPSSPPPLPLPFFLLPFLPPSPPSSLLPPSLLTPLPSLFPPQADYAEVKVFKTEKKGWGLLAITAIPSYAPLCLSHWVKVKVKISIFDPWSLILWNPCFFAVLVICNSSPLHPLTYHIPYTPHTPHPLTHHTHHTAVCSLWSTVARCARQLILSSARKTT